MAETSSFAVVTLSADDDGDPARDDEASSLAKRNSLDVPSRHTIKTAVVDKR
jgi:hypothetical protein